LTAVSAGTVGRPHGRDGSFWVDAPQAPLEVGDEVSVGGRRLRVTRRDGTDQRPLLGLAGVDDRAAAARLRGQPLVTQGELGDREWLAEELVGCRVGDLGTVARVLAGPSCDLLELDDGTLVPLVSDAVGRVDPQAGMIEVSRVFLGR
jgi:ribosomal 30S subunit maturation factor RimM